MLAPPPMPRDIGHMNAFTTTCSPLGHIRGIEGHWAWHTLRDRDGARDPMADKILRDVLGIGIEQVMTYLMRERPEFAAFEDWVLSTAGVPAPDRVTRYHAWLDGAAPPADTAAQLAAIDTADPVLDAQALAHWDEHGFVVLRAAITPDEAAACADVLWRAVDADPNDPTTWYGARANGIMVQHFQDPALAVARRSPRIHKAFAQLLGTSDLWSTTDRMSFNPPETARHPFQGPDLHWDVSLATPIPLTTGGILYLTNTAADQGALRVVPGLHRWLEPWLAGLGDADPRSIDLSAEAVPVAAGAGDLVIWREALLHGASRNTGTRPRMAQYVNFYDPAVRPNALWR